MANADKTGAPASVAERRRQMMITVSAFAAILALAAIVRFGELGVRTFQADESIASLIARQFALGGGYEHLPSAHGAFQSVATAGVFSIFGASDFTARLLPALFGVLLAALPLTMTRQLGRTGAIVAALLLAVSPTMLYYSRFAGPDIFLAFFSLAAAAMIWRYIETAERSYLYLLSFALAFMFSTTEMALVIAPIFVAFLVYKTAADLFAQTCQGPEADDEPPADHYALLSIARDAPVKDVRGAYRRLLERAEARGERELLAHAYGVLTNETRRRAYDRKLARADASTMAANIKPTEAGPRAKIAFLVCAPMIAASWPFIGSMRKRMNLRVLPTAAHPMLLITLLAAPFYGPLVQKLGFIGDRGFAGQQQIYVIGGVNRVPGGELPVMFITLSAIFAITMVAGLVWRWQVWVICWASFYGITIAMFTGMFTHNGGVWSGIWGTLDYWSRPEAEVNRAPTYYYAMVLPVYEFVPLLIGATGAVFMLLRGTLRDRIVMVAAGAAIGAICMTPASAPYMGGRRDELCLIVAAAGVLMLRLPDVTKFFAFWAVSAFFAFTIVEEKEPWLAVHIALPLALLAAKLVDDAITSVRMPELAMPSLRVNFAPRLVQASYAAIVAGAAVFALQSGLLASWGHGDVPQLDRALALRDDGETPIELLQPSQTAPDVRQIRDAIARAGAVSGEGRQIKVIIDETHGFAPTWIWYLRDYPNLELANLAAKYEAPRGAIVLADARNRPNITSTGRDVSLTYMQHWSFPAKRYAGLSSEEITARLMSASGWSGWIAYLRNRSSIGTLQSYEGVAFFPAELSVALPATRQADVLAEHVAPQQ